MVGALCRVGAIILLILAAGMAGNALWQHNHCHVPWAAVDPMQVSPCEPVELLEAEMARLRKLAEQSQAQRVGEP